MLFNFRRGEGTQIHILSTSYPICDERKLLFQVWPNVNDVQIKENKTVAEIYKTTKPSFLKFIFIFQSMNNMLFSVNEAMTEEVTDGEMDVNIIPQHWMRDNFARSKTSFHIIVLNSV